MRSAVTRKGLSVGMTDGFTLSVIITNKTDKVLYIDKANSFLYKNGTTTSYFTNAVYTTGKAKDNGVSVNLGGAANSLGIGGLAGGILSGTTVGGGTTTTNTTTIFEQRIIGVAPLSGLALTTIYISPNLSSNYLRTGSYGFGGKLGEFVDPVSRFVEKFRVGNSRTYTESSSPLSVKASIKYSLDENFTEDMSATVTASNFIENIVIDNYKGLKNAGITLPYCNPYKGRSCYSFGSGGINALVTASSLVVGVGACIAGLCIVLKQEADNNYKSR